MSQSEFVCDRCSKELVGTDYVFREAIVGIGGQVNGGTDTALPGAHETMPALKFCKACDPLAGAERPPRATS